MAKTSRGRAVIPKQTTRLAPKYSDTHTSVPFIARPPLKLAREYANKELRDQASPTEVKWLYENPVLWLRALHQRRTNLNNQIAKARRLLAPLKPVPGASPSIPFLKMKYQNDRDDIARLQLIHQNEERIADVVSLIGSDLHNMLPGDAVNVMVRLAMLIEEDDVQSAHDLALFYADEWAKRKK